MSKDGFNIAIVVYFCQKIQGCKYFWALKKIQGVEYKEDVEPFTWTLKYFDSEKIRLLLVAPRIKIPYPG